MKSLLENEEMRSVRIFLESHGVFFIKGQAINTVFHITYASLPVPDNKPERTSVHQKG